MRILQLIALAIALVAVPRPQPPGTVRVRAVCISSGSCQLIATWTRPLNWRASDSLKVVWAQTGPSAVAFPRKYTRGTADTLTLPHTAEGAYTGRVDLTTYRVGTLVAAGPVRAFWTADSIAVTPPDTVTALKVLSLIIKPDSARAYVSVAGKPITDSSTIQFCAAARLSDNTVILAENSKPIAACPPMFASMAGFRLSHAGRVEMERFTVHIDGTSLAIDTVRISPRFSELRPYQRVHVAGIDGAFYLNGEWWLRQPLPLGTNRST